MLAGGYVREMLVHALQQTLRTLGRSWWRTALFVLAGNLAAGLFLIASVFTLLSGEDPGTSGRFLELVRPGLVITAILSAAVQLLVLSLSLRVAGTQEPLSASLAASLKGYWRFAVIALPAIGIVLLVVAVAWERSPAMGVLFSILWSVPLSVLAASLALGRSRWGVDSAWKLGIARGEKSWAFAHLAIVGAGCAALLATAGVLIGGTMYPRLLNEYGPLGIFAAGGMVGTTIATLLVAPVIVAAAVTTFELLADPPPRAFDDEDDSPAVSFGDEEYVDIVSRLERYGARSTAAPSASSGAPAVGSETEVPVTAARKGSVDAELPARVRDALGSGSVVRGRWAASDPPRDVAAAWFAAATAFSETGLWPLVVTDAIAEGEEHVGDAGPGDVPPEGRVLMEAFVSRELDSLRESFQKHPEEFEGSIIEALGLTPSDPASAIGSRLLMASTGHGRAPYSSAIAAMGATEQDMVHRIVLVPAERPADVLATCFWTGGVNVDLSPGDLTAIARSWEDRFGAYLVGATSDMLWFAATRPAANSGEAVLVAAEHYAICGDGLSQNSGELADHAQRLIGSEYWEFWWD